jgi:hypothetical protein
MRCNTKICQDTQPMIKRLAQIRYASANFHDVREMPAEAGSGFAKLTETRTRRGNYWRNLPEVLVSGNSGKILSHQHSILVRVCRDTRLLPTKIHFQCECE